mmetsp:Transcript_36100/g.90590  ORF Transcript_36100/g.90590 Transcript_36100/m.90590 type:complete len:212 (-) Transcript_36100:973-1608(-)
MPVSKGRLLVQLVAPPACVLRAGMQAGQHATQELALLHSDLRSGGVRLEIGIHVRQQRPELVNAQLPVSVGVEAVKQLMHLLQVHPHVGKLPHHGIKRDDQLLAREAPAAVSVRLPEQLLKAVQCSSRGGGGAVTNCKDKFLVLSCPKHAHVTVDGKRLAVLLLGQRLCNLLHQRVGCNARAPHAQPVRQGLQCAVGVCVLQVGWCHSLHP